jgi:hypothetical protein
MAYNNYGPSSSALAYNPSIYTLAPSIASPVYPASTMPSYTTTILTSSVTLTSFVTVTSGQYVASPTPTPQDVLAIPEAIEGLRDCSVCLPKPPLYASHLC